MANPAHKRADGRAAKSLSGRAITDHADCCDCGGGGLSPCTCFPILFSPEQVTCGIPDGSVPGQNAVVAASLTITYAERKVYLPTGAVTSDVPEQTVTRDITSVITGGCGTAVRNDSDPIEFTQRAPRASPAQAILLTSVNNQASSPGWNVPVNRRSGWSRIGTPSRSSQAGPCVFLLGADTQGPHGIRIFGGLGEGTLGEDMLAVWNGSSSSLYGQTLPFGAVAPGSGITGTALVTMNLSRSACNLVMAYRSTGNARSLTVDNDYTMAYTIDLTITTRLGQCAPPGNGLRGPGGSMVDPAVDALVRGYGGCKGCGDGNPMA